MDFNLLLSALRARRRLFFMILATTVAAALIVSLVMPKSYVARASVLIDGRDEQSMRAGSPSERERTGYLQTQVDILTSPKVAHRVVTELKLAQHPKAREHFESAGGSGAIEDWLTENLGKQLKVDTSQSSLIDLSYASSDPGYAAQMANAFAKAYVDTVLELRVEPTRQASVWFDQQLKGLRENMDQAEQKLVEFQQKTGIVAIDERYDVDGIALTDLATQAARAREPSGEPGLGHAGASLPEILASPGIVALRTDLSRAEARLHELSSELGPRHPQYQRQLAEVHALRKRVEAEVGNAAAAARAAADRGRQRQERLQGAVEAQRQRVLNLKQARNQLAVLNRDVEIAQRTYDTAMQRFMASRIDSHAQQTNVSILSAAVPPSQPARPKLGLNVGLAAVIGALLGLAAVHLLEMSDRRVRLHVDLVGDPKRPPLLAVITAWDPARDRLLAEPESRLALPGPG